MLKDRNYRQARRLAAGGLTLVTLCGVLAGCAPAGAKEAPAVTKPEEAVLVKTAAVERRTFQDGIQISGNATPYEEVTVSAKVGGDILQLKGEVGMPVKAGQLLAKFDDTQYALGREKALLGVSSAELKLAEQKVDLARYESLYQQNSISQKEMEAVRNGYQLTEIALKSARADLKSAEIGLKDTAVTAPISGVVSARMVTAGENVNPGAALFSIVDLSRVYLSSGVPEDVVNQVKQGMTVQLTFEAMGGKTVQGTVTHVGPVPDQAKLYPVKILVENPEGLIKSGMFASGSIALSQGVEGLAVPKDAVVRDQGKDYVFVVSGDRAARREVTVGLGDETTYQVKSGLKAEDKIIITGLDKLKDGTLLKLQN